MGEREMVQIPRKLLEAYERLEGLVEAAYAAVHYGDVHLEDMRAAAARVQIERGDQ